ncbi:von Willebrand factor type A domain-containing protein [Simiduia curdlanivorans]|uniref:von Willebrand factor type A domain-containing protein n=1 Tax=Simiduia curdlanivorans TaxID=1492769 RepID=A0ABV8V3E6_9GAMM|nr:von Willebrand factor type A domain-containing protein [Simiduia curdlanivorans]MDN3638261.1 von Willebrand factor type A domain-containing protein [Simiduia curdlanivorans]
MSDRKPEQDLQDAFDDAAAVNASVDARARALQAALTAFDQVQDEKKFAEHQGFIQRCRQRVKSITPRLNIMANFQRKWLYTGMAAASVAALALMVTQQMPAPDVDGNAPVFSAETKKAAEQRLRAQKQNQHAVESEAARQTASTSGRADLATNQPKASKDEAYSVAEAEPVLMEEVAPSVMQDSAMAAVQMAPAKEKLAQAMPASPPQVARFAPAPQSVALGAQASTVMSPDVIAPAPYTDVGRDDFESVEENRVKRVADAPVSTFSTDVDTASYSFVRRQLNQGVLPQKDAVRLEEMLNYFDYDYPLPEGKSQPFTTNVVVSDSPWTAGNKLMHIGIKGYQISAAQKPKTNLVFLLDVSGSMNSPDKLPLVKQSMELLLSQLNPDDTIAIAVYAGAAGTVLAPTPAKEKQKILQALNQLQAGGSTAGAEGIKLAYQLAAQNFDKQAVNRIVLATDGDFNVGITDRDELKGFVEREREKGIYLSVLGFGQGNYHDHLMQELAQNGNGVAAYIDTLSEAQKVLVTEATSALFPIAQDVKIQVEFNPATVAEYRLLGYETRALNREDFNNDKVDAGDIGAGHTVTAIYELTPVGGKTLMEATRYEQTAAKDTPKSNEFALVKLRYKLPGEKTSKLISQVVQAENTANERTRVAAWVLQETQFATAVAGFAQLLKGSSYTGSWSYDDALALAQANKGDDPYGYRTEFVQLVRKAKMAKNM